MKLITIQSSSFLSLSALFVAGALSLSACSSGDSSDEGEGGDTATGGTASGTGGSGTSTGGTSLGGAGTGGGTASVCDGTSVPPVSALVSDFESDTPIAGWDIYPSTPNSGGSFTSPDSPALPAGEGNEGDADPAVAAEGANSTAHSTHFAGSGWLKYGAGMNFNLEGCKDLTAFTGVRFWAKGSSTKDAAQEIKTAEDNGLNFRVITSGSHGQIIEGGVNVGGDCVVATNKCFLPPQTNITLTADWTKYEIPFDDLVVPAGANPGSAFNGTNAMLLGWHSENADFDFFIDEVEFY